MGDLVFFCTNHSSMIQEFKVQEIPRWMIRIFMMRSHYGSMPRENATAIYGHISDWNVSAVTDMNSTFSGRSHFNENIGNWDTSSVTIMELMFYGASAFNQAIGDWNVSSVTNMTSDV